MTLYLYSHLYINWSFSNRVALDRQINVTDDHHKCDLVGLLSRTWRLPITYVIMQFSQTTKKIFHPLLGFARPIKVSMQKTIVLCHKRYDSFCKYTNAALK